MKKKLKFSYSKIPNMGDLLNELIVGDLFNVNFVHDSRIHRHELMGIGSFMDSIFMGKEKESKNVKGFLKKVVYSNCFTPCYTWGTGFLDDYSDKRTGLIRNNVEFMAVRGKLTKASIEKIISKKINPVLGDGGILAPMLIESNVIKKYKIGIIPHFREKGTLQLKMLLKRYPEAYVIDLQKDPLLVVKEISECEYIFSSSLHGLIVADAFRIPNMRIYLTNAPLGSGFKFNDYYSAYDIENLPYRIDEAKIPSINELIDKYEVTDAMVEKMKKDMYVCLEKFLKNQNYI